MIKKILILKTVLLLMVIVPVAAQPADQSGNVGVNAYIPCTVTITTRPEKRVLDPNPNTKAENPNRQTTLLIRIFNGQTQVTRFDGNSDPTGEVEFDPCNPSYAYPANALGNTSYDIYVKGLSHLRRRFTRTLAISNFSTSVNLVNDNSDSSLASRTALYSSFNSIQEYEAYSQDLYAGEISVSIDNLINSLDFSVLSTKYKTTDNKADLNQDNQVNSLDFSILSTNYWKGGDLIPGESWSQSALNFFSARENIISNQ